MKTFQVYILYSYSIDKFYIGETENLGKRLNLHLNKEFKQAFTSQTNDWKLFFTINCNDRAQARKIEAHNCTHLMQQNNLH